MKKALLIIGLCALGYGATCAADTIESKVDQMGTARYLKIDEMSARTDNNLLVVRVGITNTDDRDQKAYYRVRWLDESGDAVWDDEPWKPLLFHGDQKQHLKLVAPTVKAKDFKIEFSAEANWRK